MHKFVPIALALPLAACVNPGGSEPSAPPVPPDAALGACDATATEAYVGQTATAETGAAILAASGAEVLRWGPPNSAWTMDYRTNRVNVRYDESSTITEITCG